MFNIRKNHKKFEECHKAYFMHHFFIFDGFWVASSNVGKCQFYRFCSLSTYCVKVIKFFSFKKMLNCLIFNYHLIAKSINNLFYVFFISFLGNGVNPNHKFRMQGNNAPLHVAAHYGWTGILHILIQVNIFSSDDSFYVFENIFSS